MAMNFHGNVCGEVKVNFLALSPRKPTFSCAVPSNCSEFSCECSFQRSPFQVFFVPDSESASLQTNASGSNRGDDSYRAILPI